MSKNGKKNLFLLTDFLCFIIKAYKFVISPFLPMACRYLPSCSEYAIEALTQHGLLKGSYLTLRRLLRCNPFGGSGCDPVPPKVAKPHKKP